MNRSTNVSRVALPVAALFAVLAVLVVVAGGALGRSADPSPTPSDRPSTPPSAAPSAPSSPQPTVEPTAQPTDDPADGPITVDLDNLTDHDVSVVIDDETGILDGAVSGKPGDGMSVRWFDVKVENLDSTTLRVVWVGLPRDEQVRTVDLRGRWHVPPRLRPGGAAGELRCRRLRPHPRPALRHRRQRRRRQGHLRGGGRQRRLTRPRQIHRPVISAGRCHARRPLPSSAGDRPDPQPSRA